MKFLSLPNIVLKIVETGRALSLHGILHQKPFQMGWFSDMKILSKLWFRLFCDTPDAKAGRAAIVAHWVQAATIVEGCTITVGSTDTHSTPITTV